MRWDSSTLDYFSRTNPENVFNFWRVHKINCFLQEMIDFESFNHLNSVHFKIKKERRKILFEKNWLKLDNFLALFAFLKMLNEDPNKMRAFFSEILSNYHFSDQVAAQIVMEDVYCCINDKLLNSLNLAISYPKKKEMQPDRNVQNNNNSCFQVVVQAKGKTTEKEIFDSNSGFSEKKNPFGFGFEDSAPMQARVNQLYKEFVESEKPTANYKYAANTIKSLMRRSIHKANPTRAVKQVLSYILAGLCFTVTVAAIVYLTIQTAGLIHLAWVIPTAILAIIGGASAVAGTAITLKSTPSISNRISNFFKEDKASKNSIHGELFAERRPIGMLA